MIIGHKVTQSVSLVNPYLRRLMKSRTRRTSTKKRAHMKAMTTGTQSKS